MAMAYFMVLSQHLPEGNQKTHKKTLKRESLLAKTESRGFC